LVCDDPLPENDSGKDGKDGKGGGKDEEKDGKQKDVIRIEV